MKCDPDGRVSRRDLLGLAGGLGLAISLGQSLQGQGRTGELRPFQVDIPDATIESILRGVREARLPDRLDAADWRYGVDWNYMRDLSEYWTGEFDWRRAEANLNRYPQFTAQVEDHEIHFYYVRGTGTNPLPLILTHGWPGSVFEFLETIGPLSDPARFGGSPEDAFDVIVPSLPGFGFSSKPEGRPIGPPTTARLWHTLMTEVLGYERFGAQGGDWGNAVATQLARRYPDSLVGIHLNGTGAGPLPESEQTDETRAWQRDAAAFRASELDYFGEQQNKPQTVAFALSNNPLGAAAWIVEKLKSWSDSGNDLDQTFTKDQVLTNVMLYLVTDTVSTAVWFYRGASEDTGGPGGTVTVPTGFASFPREMKVLNPPEVMLRRSFNLVHYTRMPRGGHFAALEQPQLLVEDVRLFFRDLRG